MPGPADVNASPRVRGCRGVGVTLVCLLSAALAAGCTPEVNVKDLTVTDLSGGWYDAGVVDAKNKLVPTVKFRLQNPSGEPVQPVTLTVLFKRLVGGVEEEFEDVYLQRVEFSEGSRTTLLTVRPETGYTGDPPQSRAEMLENSHFVDVRAIIFARQGSTWIELARIDLPRTLITQ
jgi:hypothetical protein